MRVYFSPIVGLKKINYKIKKDSLEIIEDGVSDLFDFTGLPNGEVDISSIKTSLGTQPIVALEKIEGVLYVELLNFIGDAATEFEKFPNWIEVGE